MDVRLKSDYPDNATNRKKNEALLKSSKKQSIALGGSLPIVLPPPPLGHPLYCDNP